MLVLKFTALNLSVTGQTQNHLNKELFSKCNDGSTSVDAPTSSD